MKTNEERLAAALDAGDIDLAKLIANSSEYRAEVEAAALAYHTRSKPDINTTAADNASKRVGFDYEAAILARNERILFTM